MHRLNIIGCGKVAQSLARLWRDQGLVEVQAICNRTLASAQQATVTLRSGQALATIAEMPTAELFLIGTDDGQITPCAEQLAQSGILTQDSLVFHCSGALASDALSPCQAQGATTASLHPVRSFAQPLQDQTEFVGTYCGLEGGPGAVHTLRHLIEAIGGRPFAIDPQHKTLYHAAAVMACNYFTALESEALRLYTAAGIDEVTALALLGPLLQGTLDNLLRLGPAAALTGPITRGDSDTVSRHLKALDDWDGDLATLYRDLGRVAVRLARTQGQQQLHEIERILHPK